MIIEFYGLPGAGKSTSTNILKERYFHKKKIYYSNDIMEEIQKTKIKHIKTKNRKDIKEHTFSEVIELCMYLKSKKMIINWVKLWLMLKSPFSFFVRALEIMTLYQFCEEHYKDDIILVDHGIAQNLISLVYINPVKSIDKFSKYASNVINKNTYYVHIQIDVDKSLKRLRSRESQHGRLPKIESDEKLLEALYFQNGMFSYCNEMINRIAENKTVVINNNFDLNVLEKQLSKIIVNLEKNNNSQRYKIIES